MKIKIAAGNITELAVDAIIVSLFEGLKTPGGAAAEVDAALNGAITQLIAKGEIKGKTNEITLIHTLGRMTCEKAVVIGLGKKEDLTADKVRSAAASACRMLRSAEAKRIATILHGAEAGSLTPEQSAQAIAEGSIQGLYSFRRHITKKPDHGEIAELLILEKDQANTDSLKTGVKKGTILAEAANFARDLVNQPANFMTPSDLAEAACEVATSNGLDVEILEKADIEKLGMGGLLGVAQGSLQPPKFIVLTYRGNRQSKKTLGLIGKGLTFDSGGISIKPADKMDEMKGDMAGGASVIATMQALSRLKPKINVTCLVPATENMPSGTALKPGDILKTMGGKTVEVVNTDAEGRLILADALCYANKLKLSPLVDIATLTGACYIALGDICSGAFGNDQDLIDKLIASGDESGERIWQMPMYDEYKEKNKSDIADVKNSGGRWGGAITAAQFLAEFVDKTPWVHIDIAGTFLSDKDKGYLTKGATGIPVRTLVNLVLKLAEK